jgi:hypothetical protein
MDRKLLTQLLRETISLAEEEGVTSSMESFISFVGDMLPQDVINDLEEILDSENFLEDIWKDKYDLSSTDELNEEQGDMLQPGQCLICERHTRLTRHHVFPRETHHRLIKKGYDAKHLNTTIPICRMCHNAVHRFFSNDTLAESYYTIDLLLSDEKFHRYAKWASTQ